MGAPEEIDYVQAASVTFDKESLSVKVGATAELQVKFTPENASNRRYAYAIADESVAALNAIDGLNMSIRGVRAGETKLTARTMNNNRTANLTITVTAE